MKETGVMAMFLTKQTVLMFLFLGSAGKIGFKSIAHSVFFTLCRGGNACMHVCVCERCAAV